MKFNLTSKRKSKQNVAYREQQINSAIHKARDVPHSVLHSIQYQLLHRGQWSVTCWMIPRPLVCECRWKMYIPLLLSIFPRFSGLVSFHSTLPPHRYSRQAPLLQRTLSGLPSVPAVATPWWRDCMIPEFVTQHQVRSYHPQCKWDLEMRPNLMEDGKTIA